MLKEKPAYLLNDKFDDIYFDVVDAIDEAQQIYLINNNLIERVGKSLEIGAPFIIGETGFGAGRLVVSLMQYLDKSSLKNVYIEYNSVELYPMSPERMHNILNGFRERVGDKIDALVKAYQTIDINVSGWHTAEITQSFGTLKLNLWVGEALEMASSLEKSCDVWFLDGHSPKKNPEMWRPELLLEIGKKTKVGGTCATFTVAGAVKRALTDAGFIIKKFPGCGGKNEVLQGVKMIESRCGLSCEECSYRELYKCGGCIQTQGNPFHGECPVAKCCQAREIVHCGKCPNIPCKLLTKYSHDSEHGDNPKGARIEQCKKWAET